MRYANDLRFYVSLTVILFVFVTIATGNLRGSSPVSADVAEEGGREESTAYKIFKEPLLGRNRRQRAEYSSREASRKPGHLDPSPHELAPLDGKENTVSVFQLLDKHITGCSTVCYIHDLD